jgi:biopolymer transport protein ExbB/TolQ
VILSYLTPLKETMHAISSGLLAPTIAILLLLVALVIIELGSLLVEVWQERRSIKADVPALLSAFQGKNEQEILQEIELSQLFLRQKSALQELIRFRDLPPASHQGVARRLLADAEFHYMKITNRTDLIARVGPMFGLMATLIPLGPGLIALGQGDPKGLADSLLTAFDATVTGLGAAGIAFFISRLRKRWYEDYLTTLEVLLEGILEVFEGERRIEEPEQA